MTLRLGMKERHAKNQLNTRGLQIYGKRYDVHNKVAHIITQLLHFYDRN